MSKSQIKRLHQQQELEKALEQQEEEKEETVQVQRKGPANRFAFFDDEDNEETGDKDSDEDEKEEGGSEVNQKAKDKKKAKKNKKKKNTKKTDVKEEETENQMLARLAALNAKEAKKSHTDMNFPPSLSECMKIDMKLFDMSAEIKRKLGKAFKEVVTPGEDQNKFPPGKRATGRIVKNKPRWFPDKDYGVKMVYTHTSNESQWFLIRHSSSYEAKEQMFWLAESSMQVELIRELLDDTPYHLNSLLLMANVYRMNEDLNQAADMIERGIWYIDQHSAATFEPFNWHHRMDYLDYENRSFYLLLHRHMLNAANKRCWETALNTCKLIFKLDPERDPLAVLSIIDVYALQAKQYTWITNVYYTAKRFKKLDLLPNWPYSVALSKFCLAKTDEEKENAETELCTAIRHFPSMVVVLMDILQIHPDSDVMNCKMLTSFVADNEKDSLKLLVKIYAKQTAEIWKIPENLLFLEQATRKVATSKIKKDSDECEEWREKRAKMYHGRSPNVDRFAQLLEEIPTDSLTDPVAPKNGRYAYRQRAENPVNVRGANSFLSGFLTSLIPHFEGDLGDQLGRYGNHFVDFILQNAHMAHDAAVDMADIGRRWMERRVELDEEDRELREFREIAEEAARLDLPEGRELDDDEEDEEDEQNPNA